MTGNGEFIPFSDEDHITKIVIPFQKKDEDGNLYDVPSKDVLEKLNSLNGEILLFLTHIRNLFWIDMSTKHHAMITLKEEADDDKLVTGRILSMGRRMRSAGISGSKRNLIMKRCPMQR